MKKRHLFTLGGFLAGAACALVQGVTGADVMITLMKPFTLLGNRLRAWSLSGAKGNALTWAVLAVLSLLPVLCILIARRKRKQAGDWLFLLSGAAVFGALFLLINPTLLIHPAMTEALSSSPEVLTGGPVFAALSVLLLSIVTRWSGGLMQIKKQESRLLFWTQAILTASMALIAFSAGLVMTDSLRAVFADSPQVIPVNIFESESVSGMGSDALSAWVNSQYSDNNPLTAMASPADEETSTLIGLLLTAVGLIPSFFSVWTLDAAGALASSMGRSFFSEETDKRASILAVRARYTLIAAIACMAGRNVLTVLLGQWMFNTNVSFSLPLDDLLISCGAMLLARLLSAACRVKRDNDLMI